LLVATVKDTNKLRAFLRGLGDNIEVIAPQKLRQYFVELSERLFFAYQEEVVQDGRLLSD
jgi:predicted DNA-binding transcriptional regulator YafY